MTNHVDEWLDGAERKINLKPMPTGRNNGLCQDYCRKLSLWFASRIDARHTLRRWFGEKRKDK